ncbi:hypothetical protein AM493_13100 [Flavobacterium akiainvivens]|uniref:Uncharacterized protein n=1 Tax=Flavobacterium akiainvivens TaxID=1202724 RepID=A0A0M9VIN8_9FLAO|nr:hypothetical protein [Flavobacterium akiainvivens]KOS06860.1 hypothetical protein AM493_13100 [Flavobacterium akiainvivens]SFQ69244.1 hypothetical protein SAMN05444144_11513 [Flavobacterium akiainvivens]
MKPLITLLFALIMLPAYSQDTEAVPAANYFMQVDKQGKTTDSLINAKAAGLVRIDAMPLTTIAVNNATGEETPATVKGTGFFYNGRLIKLSVAGANQGLLPKGYDGWFTENYYFGTDGLILVLVQCQNPPEGVGKCEGPMGQHRIYFKDNSLYNPKTFSRVRVCGWPPAAIIAKATVEQVIAQAGQYAKS